MDGGGSLLRRTRGGMDWEGSCYPGSVELCRLDLDGSFYIVHAVFLACLLSPTYMGVEGMVNVEHVRLAYGDQRS